MSIVRFEFLVFMALVTALYYLLPRRCQWAVLLCASVAFYLSADLRYLPFLCTTALSTHVCARVIGNRQEKMREDLKALPRADRAAYRASAKKAIRRWLLPYLLLNFGLLFLCKGMLLAPIRTRGLSFLTLGLPLGISFYTFQSVGYVVDVSWGKTRAEKNPGKTALFVAYFPTIVQGPISKYNQLAPQLFGEHPFEERNLSLGFQRILWGYFKKLVIADRIAPAVQALRDPAYGGMGFLLLCIAYAVELYADFSGGIDIVIGFSQALGIQLQENFTRPFFSKNTAQFWRRWHISLGKWLKDYIFYPISVSQPMETLTTCVQRKPGGCAARLPLHLATFVTWVATGIWHGLTPNFLLWGVLNGMVIILSQELTPLYNRFHARFCWNRRSWYGGFEMLRTSLLMALFLTCNLYPNVGLYGRRVLSLVTDLRPWVLWNGSLRLGLPGLDWAILAVGCGLLFAVSVLQEKRGSVRELLAHAPAVVRWGLLFALLLAVLLVGRYGIGYNASSFIYNQF